MLLNLPRFFVHGLQESIFMSFPIFEDYTEYGLLRVPEEESKGFKVVQTACGQNSSYFLTNQGHVYAQGANDRWQCS